MSDSIPGFHCEAKLHGFRRTKEGVVVSFVLHPQEVPQELALDPLGTRYQLGMCAISDDEQPMPASRHEVGEAQNMGEITKGVFTNWAENRSKILDSSVPSDRASTGEQPGCGTKERRQWYSIAAPERAAILCADQRFCNWLSDHFSIAITDAEDAADWLRSHLGIKSRSELTQNEPARRAFEEIERAYRVQHGLEAEPR